MEIERTILTGRRPGEVDEELISVHDHHSCATRPKPTKQRRTCSAHVSVQREHTATMQLLPSLASTSLEEILGVPPSSIRAHCDLHQHNLSAQQQLRKEHCQRCLRRLLTHLQKQPQQEVSIQNKKQQQPQPARD